MNRDAIELDESQQGDMLHLNLLNVKQQSFALARSILVKHSTAVDPQIRKTIEQDLPPNLNEVPFNKLTALAYKSMNNYIYVGVTVLLLAGQLYLAIVLNDLGDIFGFVGTFSATSLCYFNPSILFITAYNRYATKYF